MWAGAGRARMGFGGFGLGWLGLGGGGALGGQKDGTQRDAPRAARGGVGRRGAAWGGGAGRHGSHMGQRRKPTSGYVCSLIDGGGLSSPVCVCPEGSVQTSGKLLHLRASVSCQTTLAYAQLSGSGGVFGHRETPEHSKSDVWGGTASIQRGGAERRETGEAGAALPSIDGQATCEFSPCAWALRVQSNLPPSLFRIAIC